MSQSSRQADAIARIALELTDRMTNRDVLASLLKAYRAGWHDALDQSAADLGKAIIQHAREGEGA